ncbi:restriction endonuclease subunit S [Algoriphagus persicinus]|uniref:restriction endonuclease subunit S n=1 Tax=Algoriphagus persicinus TaxID=3108754 RepID=UPI002B3CEC7F|nr:restriction endonuclease subunit S [Algoriphagus sp. E1-3-M2]MEB2786384.1 restriction endonuclease subunit S [Algoriphagus sp. E1-3-M2]
MVVMNSLIKEITMGPFGSDIKVDNFIDDGVPVLNGSNLSGVKLSENSFKYISIEKAKSLKKANTKRGDIVITHRGTLGQISYIPSNSKFENYIISQSQFRVTLKTELVDPVYFTYYFHSAEGQKRLLSFKNHVGVPALAQATSNFRLLEFPYIELGVQRKIAKVLSDLDSKIELNNKINAELEGMAKLIYEYWFVQFDFPFDFASTTLSTDAQGKPADDSSNPKDVKPYKSSGGKMVWNKELKREIPEGWEVKELKKIATTGSGGTPLSTRQEYYKNGNIPWINSGEVNQPFIVKAEKFITEAGLNNSSAKIFRKGTILMAMYGATAGKVSMIDIEAGTNQAICGINPIHNYYDTFIKIGLEDLYKYLVNLSSGSARDNLSQDIIRELKFIIPSEELLKRFHHKVSPSMLKILMNLKENESLSNLRDWLLPMLMNGQVKVNN